MLDHMWWLLFILHWQILLNFVCHMTEAAKTFYFHIYFLIDLVSSLRSRKTLTPADADSLQQSVNERKGAFSWVL